MIDSRRGSADALESILGRLVSLGVPEVVGRTYGLRNGNQDVTRRLVLLDDVPIGYIEEVEITDLAERGRLGYIIDTNRRWLAFDNAQDAVVRLIQEEFID